MYLTFDKVMEKIFDAMANIGLVRFSFRGY